MAANYQGMSRKGRTIGVLDIGSSKVCCLIAQVMSPMGADAGEPTVQALGLGHKQSHGVKVGAIVDLEAASDSIRSAVADAEQQAGLRLENVSVGVSCGRLESRQITARSEISGAAVTASDLNKLRHGASQFLERGGRSIVAMVERDYQIDGSSGVRDPLGMAGHRLAASIHAVTADNTDFGNLLRTIEMSYLTPELAVVSAAASGLSVTSEHERQLGVTCIDIGASTTLIATFEQGHFTWTDIIPTGGEHVTYDISHTVAIPLDQAERIKVLYGTIARAGADDHQIISLSGTHDRERLPARITRAQLQSIVRPRVDRMLVQISERLGQAMERGLISKEAGSLIVLTGGASQLIGLAEYATGTLRRPVQCRVPVPLGGLPADLAVASFAALNGLLTSTLRPQAGRFVGGDARSVASGYAGRVRQWIKESF